MKNLFIKKHISRIFIVLVLFSILPFFKGYAKDPSFYASESKLATGKWVKLQVQENAIYKLSYEDIQAMGINPAKAKIYGYGGWMLDESFKENNYADDLPEVPVWMSGSNAVLDPGEYILFYGKGVVKWAYDNRAAEYKHKNNPYSMYGYYFITEETGGPAVVPTAASETVTTSTTLNTFDDYAKHEQDLVAVVPSGRELFGENFASKQNQTFKFNINNLSLEEASVSMSFVSLATVPSTVSLFINGSNVLTSTMSAATTSTPVRVSDVTKKWNLTETGAIEATVNFSQSGYNAYLNYLRLNVKRFLKPDGAYTFFRNRANLANNCTYEISNATNNMFVLELTSDVRKMPTSFSGGKMSFNASKNASQLREFVLINPEGSFPKPDVAGTVENQNLHALPQTDMVIITPPLYQEQAIRLAQEHINRDQLRVQVVYPDKIYNEFSSGNPDATAFRRFMKMFYDRAENNEAERPKYLLLFGDGSHDNRRLTDKWRQLSSDGYLITYQSENSTSKSSNSYVTDDYFGYLDDNTTIPSANLRLGIGRFPVKTVKEAQVAVDKVISYMDGKNPGNWTNNIVFLGGDDDDESEKTRHIGQADAISKTLEQNHPEYLISKIYYAAFKEVNDRGYPTFPDAKKKLEKKLDNGALVVDYVGHGASTKIARDVVTMADVNLMKFNRLPLWITATCDFGRFDDVSNSASEALFLNPKSGGIAVITAARTVSSGDNDRLNGKLFVHMFSKESNGQWPRLGDIMRKGKNDAYCENNLSFNLLGDPALKLAYPESTVRIESINGIATGTTNFQLKSKETVTIKGSVLDRNGEVDTDFSGKVNLTVMDCPQDLSSLQKFKDSRGDYSYFLFSEYLNTVSNVTGKVTNGEFTMSFLVPKEISHGEKNGKMSFYAVNESADRGANGSFSQFFLKGISEDAIDLNEGPQIHALYLNDSIAFARDAKVNEKPYFVAKVSDALGINASGLGVGHDIMLIIDNKPAYSYPLNAYFEADEDNPGYGTIRFNIPDSLPAGDHTLTFRIWNIMNLSASQTVPFTVQTGKAPAIFDLIAYPNPARTDVNFLIKHDRPETLVTVKISVYDLAGRIIWEYAETAYPDDLSQSPVSWDLTSSTGNRVKPGIYLYRASISNENSKESSASKKLIVLGQ